MSTSIPAARLVLLLVLLALPATVSAQQIFREPSPPPTLSEQYRLVIGRLTVDFWNARLSEYRQQIDATLSAPDLLQVNELRARTSLLFDRMWRFDEMERAREQAESQMPAMVDTTATVAANTDDEYEYGETTTETSTAPASDYDEAALERERQREWEREQAERRREDLHRLERVLSGDEAAVAALVTRSEFRDRSRRSNERFIITEEMAEVRYVANWIARNYRSDMEALAARFVADYDSYHKAVRLETRRFITENRTAILQDSEVFYTIEAAIRPDNSLQSLTGTGFEAQAARSYVEAALILYSGQDMRELMTIGQLPLSSSIGERLPASVSVSQNSPNPATARTVIPYTLSEHVTGVLVEVLDTKGKVVATFDQGSREPGDHWADIDVTTLPGGTYLYQLRITTTNGDRLYSRSMTVDK